MKGSASRWLLVVWIVTLVVAGLTVRKYFELRREREQLESERSERLEHLVADGQSSRPEADGAGLSQAEKLELMRLRNEVTQLRAANEARVKGEAVKARSGVEKLTQSPVSDPETEILGQEKIPRDQWAFQGYATPEAAYISGMWAMKEGQLQTMLETFTPEERQRFEAMHAGNTEEEIKGRFQKEFGAVSALRVKEQEQVSPTEVILQIEMDRPQSFTKRVRMNQVGNEWKAGGPVDQNDPLAFYRKNPELMKRYFPHLFHQQQQGQQPPSESRAE